MAETVNYGGCACCGGSGGDHTSCCAGHQPSGDLCATLTGDAGYPPFSYMDPVVIQLTQDASPPLGTAPSWQADAFHGFTFTAHNWNYEAGAFPEVCQQWGFQVHFFCDANFGHPRWLLQFAIVGPVPSGRVITISVAPTAVSCDPLAVTFVIPLFLHDNGDGTYTPVFGTPSPGYIAVPITVVITPGPCGGAVDGLTTYEDPDCP